MISINNIISELIKSNPAAIADVEKSYRLAETAHYGVFRESGEPYITHPLNVALNLLNMQVYDKDTICAALLHDVVEDTYVTLEDIEHEINPTVAELVDGVTKMRGLNYTKQQNEQATTRKILNGFNKDVRIVLIKLADRLHNMRTLQFKKNLEKRKSIAYETLELYVPLALSLGAYKTKKELEDLAFMYIEPGLYRDILGKREEIEFERKSCLHELERKISYLLSEQTIPNVVLSRVLNVYGIYKKIRQGYDINNIYDLLYLKVLVKEVNECYRALAVVHRNIAPINGRFKDYIYTPKTNFYRSLHTTGATPEGLVLKTKIRTFDMDDVAAYGVSSVWNIKEEKKPGEFPRRMTIAETQEEIRTKLQFANTLQEIDGTYHTDAEYIEALKQEVLTSEHIYVTTTTGEVIELPVGATVFDFASITDPEFVDQLAGAFINGILCGPTAKLKNGDIVQIKKSNIIDRSRIIQGQPATSRGKEKMKVLIDGQKS